MARAQLASACRVLYFPLLRDHEVKNATQGRKVNVMA
jgi:hypothetical protein